MRSVWRNLRARHSHPGSEALSNRTEWRRCRGSVKQRRGASERVVACVMKWRARAVIFFLVCELRGEGATTSPTAQLFFAASTRGREQRRRCGESDQEPRKAKTTGRCNDSRAALALEVGGSVVVRPAAL
ncbi:hypothetical protein MTO96_002047 [Rhipicephalus appendiculatus]